MKPHPRSPWLPWLLGTCIAAGVAWITYAHFGDRRDRGTRPAPVVPAANAATIVLQETGIRIGASATTPDGAFTIRVERISGRTVRLVVKAKIGDVYVFDKAEPGRRLVVPAPDATYDLDLLRVSGKVAYVAMSRRTSP